MSQSSELKHEQKLNPLILNTFARSQSGFVYCRTRSRPGLRRKRVLKLQRLQLQTQWQRP